MAWIILRHAAFVILCIAAGLYVTMIEVVGCVYGRTHEDCQAYAERTVVFVSVGLIIAGYLMRALLRPIMAAALGKMRNRRMKAGGDSHRQD